MRWVSAVVFTLVTLFAVDSRAAPQTFSANAPDKRVIVISQNASEETTQAAETLAEYLGKITGQRFDSRTTDPTKGIVVGTKADWPKLSEGMQLDPGDPLRREAYVLRSSDDTLYIIGATDLAVTHGVWDLLFRLGHRQYLPGADWEHLPAMDEVSIAIDERQSPDFIQRYIRQGGGDTKYDRKPVKHWDQVNRLGSGFQLSMSHVYDKIRIGRKETFAAHPEYLALIDGKRNTEESNGVKLCISNPQLREVVVDWAIEYIETMQQRYDYMDGVSMEPSDGLGWCECEPCNAMGSVTDQVHFLANEVAERIKSHFDSPKYVGVLAYGYHSPPPSEDFEIHPKVLVSVTQGFLRGGWTFEQLLDVWGQRVTMLGTYDYLGVVQWSWSMPGDGRATRRDRPAQIVPWLYDRNVRLYTAEREGNWGPAGFNLFIMSRLLWDRTEASKTEAYYSEFLEQMFGPCAPEMRAFFDLIDGSNKPLLSADLIGRMYRHLDAADRLNNQYGSDPKIQRRIDDLTIYTRYVELFRAFKEAAPGDDQSNAYAELMTFVYRGRERMMYHGSEIFRRFERKDKSLRIPDGTDARTPEAENPWKDSSPFSRGDFVAMRRDGIKNNELFTFSPEVFDDDLQPAQVLVSPSSERGGFDRGASGKQVLHAWIDDPTKPLKITVTGGLIRHYRDRGDVRISLFKADEVSGDEDAMPLDTASVPPDGEPYVIELRSDHAGLHRIELIDGGDRTMVDWQRGTKVVWVCDQKNGTNFYGPWTFCFYVPKGQTRVAGYTSHASGSIVDPSGATALDFRSMGSSGFFDIPVPAGADGRIWWMQRCKGRRMLMTTPPVFARSPDELLLPRNIIEKDGIGK